MPIAYCKQAMAHAATAYCNSIVQISSSDNQGRCMVNGPAQAACKSTYPGSVSMPGTVFSSHPAAHLVRACTAGWTANRTSGMTGCAAGLHQQKCLQRPLARLGAWLGSDLLPAPRSQLLLRCQYIMNMLCRHRKSGILRCPCKCSADAAA